MDVILLDNLYKLYRFQVLPISNKQVRVYAYTSKYFSNADVIILDEETDEKTLKDLFGQIEALGFTVNIRNYKSLEEAEEKLFDGFFDTKTSKNLVLKSYDEYREKISKIIFGEYEYVLSEYEDLESGTIKNDNIVFRILTDFKEPGPVLVILEAAAGFGKTSTAYEVLRSLVINLQAPTIPLFTELSRNRQATIFKYVLYDELNRRFTGINLELVYKHIMDGRIPLIIDGFDELLRAKKKEQIEDKFEDAEPMLETIKELLKGEAKVLLTTRRTAIFSDDDFFSWIEKNTDSFHFRRYSLSTPTIRHWITPTREKDLQRAGLNLRSISNPVLLAYIRSMDDEQFADCVNNIDLIIDDYIKKLMERENERQDLNMTIIEQKNILRTISKYFTEYDITSDLKENIEKLMLERQQRLLFTTIDRYSINTRPTVDQLINKLIIHAFLDRKSESSHQIGFVNDFILGTFVGENLLEEKGLWIGTERFIDFILTAYIPRGAETKKNIYEILNKHLLDYLNIQKRVFIDNYLLGCINRSLDNEYFENIEFRNCFIQNQYSINDCLFSVCEFHNITFDFEKCQNIHFINCSFYNSSFDFDSVLNKKINFINCSTSPAVDFYKLYELEEKKYDLPAVESNEKKVLEKFWPTGKDRFIPHKRPSTLRLGVPPEEVEEIDKAIESLIRRNIIIQRKGHHSLELNLRHINEIKKILGR